MLPPETSEGGVFAGVLYAMLYAVPLAIVGLGLGSRVRWIVALIGLLALGLVVVHSAPLIGLQLPFEELPWQRSLLVALSVICWTG
jgi:hypothetical protein